MPGRADLIVGASTMSNQKHFNYEKKVLSKQSY